jgi:hypothetical protein
MPYKEKDLMVWLYVCQSGSYKIQVGVVGLLWMGNVRNSGFCLKK